MNALLSELKSRLSSIREDMSKKSVDSLLVSKEANVIYLTGGESGVAVIEEDNAILWLKKLYIEHNDNFLDMRERFPKTVREFRRMMQFGDNIPLTFFIDRGIFKIALFCELRDELNVNIVTWEKNYKKGQ